MDLVLQSPSLGPDAIEAFRVACLAAGVTSRPGVARLERIQDDGETRSAIAALAAYWQCDAAVVRPGLRLRDFAVLAMDMDSTLISIECVDEIAALAGRGREVAAITEAAMRGEIADYADSLRRRVALLAGLDATVLARVHDERLRLNPGAEVLLAAARRAQLRTLLVSGGFTYFTDRLRERLGFDATASNQLEIADGRLTGRVTGPEGGPIVDAEAKAQAVRDLCARLGVPTTRVIAIGDGANDLRMMAIAGLSVAYRAKPKVQAQAHQTINHAGLDAPLAWFAEPG